MSAIDIFTRSRTAESSRLNGYLSGLVTRLRNYSSYRRTLTELDNLTDRELADLGLSRHQIRSVAYREAYDN